MEQAIRILLVEDELIIAEDIAAILRRQQYHICGIAKNLAEAKSLLHQHTPDLVLLDIHLYQSEPGTELAHLLNHEYRVPFIYITSYSDPETMQQVKETLPHGFLLKPFSKESLLAAVEIALYHFSVQKKAGGAMPAEPVQTVINQHWVFKDGPRYIRLPWEDVLFVKSEGNYVQVVTAQKKFLLRQTLKAIGSLLPEAFFFQCHRQYIINMKQVKEVKSLEVLVAQHVLPVSKETRPLLLEKINAA